MMRTADPIETAPARLEKVGEVTRQDGGWVYAAIAQFYGIVNDRLMIFRYGSGTKTIAERVPDGRVKVHSGHPWDPNHQTIMGRVLEARESQADGGVWYRAYISKSEAKLAEKLLDGSIDENSLELNILRRDSTEVAVDQVPEHSRRWVEMAPSGNALVREILEWRWVAIGLVSSSSQGRRAILDPPTVAPVPTLPTSTSTAAWNAAEAAARVEAWARGGGQADRAAARLDQAYLLCGASQRDVLVTDVEGGVLVLSPPALDAAKARVAALAESDPHTAIALARRLGQIEGRLTDTAAGGDNQLVIDESGSSRPAFTPPAPTVTSSPHQPTAGPGTSPPTETAGSSGAGASDDALEDRLRELRITALRLGARLPDQEVGAHAGDGPGTDPDRPG